MFPLLTEPECGVCGFPASAAKLAKVLGGYVCVDSAACVTRVIVTRKSIT